MFAFASIIALQLIASWNAITIPQNTTKSTNANQEAWLVENYPTVRDSVFQKDCQDPGLSSPESRKWEVCILIFPPFDQEFEYEIHLKEFYSGKVSAQIILPKGESLFSQLRALHKAHPDYGPDRLRDLIATERRTANEKEMSALQNLAAQFGGIRLSPIPPDEIMPDPTTYEIQISSNYGMKARFTLYGPGSAAPRQRDPLIQWAEAIKKLLLSD